LRLSFEKAPAKFPEILKEASESITEEVEKLRHLADEFSRFARLPSPSPKRANLNEVVQKSIVLYANGDAPKIHFESGEVLDASFDPEQISQVLHNLLRNAIDATGTDGIIHIVTGTSRHQDRDWVFLAVQDNGAGMDEEVRRHVFTPYFTTKQKGTGLGLAIVHRIIQEHKGNILIDSTPGRGTRIEIQLPLT
jgi:nitrogen fixation/metabolism regulation signal transduction histidine kinase